MTPALPPAAYINSNEALRTLAAKLSQEPLLAIDTESNSLYAYRERVCLVQISTRTADYIVDPLAKLDMKLLAPLMSSPTIEKVFHAAEYDLICMTRDFGYTFANLFDTMAAARICGNKAIGLANLLQEFCGVTVDKSHQRDDWGQRPLHADSLRYAQLDTHYLPALRDKLYEQLQQMKRLEEAHESFLDLCYIDLPDREFDPEGYWKLGLPNDLNRREMALLREVYLLREAIAQERDIPPFKIFTNSTLIALVKASPNSLSQLMGVDGMSPAYVRMYHKRIIAALARGRHAKPPPPPRPSVSEPGVTERYQALHNWRKERAITRGVESDVIISKDTLWMLAKEAPTTLEALRKIRGLGPWRLQTYGEEILRVIQEG
jgi:ribonuclease D